MATNTLTTAEVNKAAKTGQPNKLFDGGGLFLQGGRYWRFKYRRDGKEKLLALGVFPNVTLAQARQGRDQARAKLDKGIDPSAERKALKQARANAAADSVEALAREWWERKHKAEVTPKHAENNLRRLEMHLFPALGRKPIADVTPAELLHVLQRIQERGKNELARRVRTLCGQFWRYAVVTGRANRDIAADLVDELTPARPTHLPAVTDPAEIAGLLRAIHAYTGAPETINALKLSPLVFARPGELRQMQWADVDLNAGTWMRVLSKTGGELVTPLPRQAVEILREMESLSGGRSDYFFPSARSMKRPMSENAITAALARMGLKGEMTAHGFRAMARTALDEQLHYRPDIIEHQLGHVVKDANGRAYNRTAFLEQRREMLQRWADWLDELRKDGN